MKPKPDCPDFKESAQALWICFWWWYDEEAKTWYCSRPEWEERFCQTAGQRNRGWSTGGRGWRNMMDRCPECGAETQIGSQGFVPSFACGSLKPHGQELMQSWGCKQIAALTEKLEAWRLLQESISLGLPNNLEDITNYGQVEMFLDRKPLLKLRKLREI